MTRATGGKSHSNSGCGDQNLHLVEGASVAVAYTSGVATGAPIYNIPLQAEVFKASSRRVPTRICLCINSAASMPLRDPAIFSQPGDPESLYRRNIDT